MNFSNSFFVQHIVAARVQEPHRERYTVSRGEREREKNGEIDRQGVGVKKKEIEI